MRTVTVYRVSVRTHLPPCESSRASSTHRLNIKARDRPEVYQMEDFTWIPNSGNLYGLGVTEALGGSAFTSLGTLLLSSRAALLWDPRCLRLPSGLYLLPRPFRSL